MDECIPDFLVEVGEALVSLESDLKKWEATLLDVDLLGGAFRILHNIKGTCGFLGLSKMGQICHAVEGVLSLVRSGELLPTPYLMGILKRSLAAIRDIVEVVEASGAEGVDVDGLLAELNAIHCPDPVLSIDSEPLDSLFLPAIREATSNPRDRCLLSIDGATPSIMPGESLTQRRECFPPMKACRQQISVAWSALPRVTRDLAHKLGKKIDLVVEGTDIELNQQILELMKDPLIHLVRNAADHGLESPDVRVASGKSPTGRIRLRAFYDGDFVVIAIEDDGRGLDANIIRRKAVERRLATAVEAVAMPDASIFRFVLLPGFSTLDHVTNISGRGIGLDVVRNNVESIGGYIEIESWPNRGTSFSIRIPMHREISPSFIPNGYNAGASANEKVVLL